jgi:DNA-binding CsgD family transcriptional regulator
MTADAELLERDQPLALLAGRVERLRQLGEAGGSCVLVHGEAGVGKTSLLRRLRCDGGSGLRWLWGACEPLLSPAPLGPLIDFLDQLPPSLSAAVRSGTQVQMVLSGMLDLLRDRRQPTVMVVDDVHWADSATLDLLRFLGRRIDSTHALLVLSYRDDAFSAGHPLLGVLGALPSAFTQRVALAPLSREAVGCMARQAGCDPGAIYQATAGNPFFVCELLSGDPTKLPATVRDAVLARAAQLPPEARELLDLASVVPSFLEHTLLDALVPDAARALAPCVEAGLLLNDAQGVRFRHELVRQAIEQALPPDWARSLHSAVFEALAPAEVSAARRVHHAERAGLVQALRVLAPQAAREACKASAHRQAAMLYSLALSHADGLGADERAALMEAQADECMVINLIDDAIAARSQALVQRRAIGDRRGEGINLRMLARLQWMRLGPAAALPHAEAAVAALEGVDAGRELSMAYGTMAQLHLLGPVATPALQWGRRGLALAERLGDAEALTFSLNTVACAELRTGDNAASWQRLERSLALALEQGLEAHAARAYLNLTSLSLVHRHFDAVERWCNEGIRYCDARDLDSFTGNLRLRRAYGWLETTRWSAVKAELDSVNHLPFATPLEREQALHVAMLLRLRLGDVQARAYWREMVTGQRALSIDPWYTPQAVARAEAAWLEGEHDAVERITRQALPAAMAAEEPWRTGQLACWLRRIGRLPPGFAARVAAPGRAELAGDLAGAAEAWARLGCRYEQALVLMGGTASQLREALAVLDELGAVPAARIARRRLREQGEHHVSRGPYRHSRGDPLGLTAREREVLELLRQGLSHRDIAGLISRSERTVSNHAAALLAKLGVHTRAEALALAFPAGAGAAGVGMGMGVPKAL